MSLAERIYNDRTRNRAKETPEDRAYKSARIYNALLRQIEAVTEPKTYLQCKNSISSFAQEAGKNSLDVVRLNGKLNERIQKVAQDTQQNIGKINAEIEEIKSDKFTESVEVLQELNIQAEYRLLYFMMQLGTNNDGNTGNRRKLGNWVMKADRADAIALMKLASLPRYVECFTAKQKQIILEKSKSEAEIIYERNKEPLLAEKSSQLGREYMKSMNLQNTLKKVGDSEGYYFKDGEATYHMKSSKNKSNCKVPYVSTAIEGGE